MAESEPILESEETLGESFSFLTETRSCLASPELRRSLRTARTWMLTIAILLSTCFGLASIVLLLTAALGAGFGAPNILGVVFLLSVLLVFGGLPVVLIFRFSARTRRFLATSQLRDLLSVLKAQRFLWNTLGVYGILTILLNLAGTAMMILNFRF